MEEIMKILFDAMGGDNAPDANITGAVNAIEKINAEIILISKDEYIYSRCILHHFISGVRTVEQLNFSEDDFINKYNINKKLQRNNLLLVISILIMITEIAILNKYFEVRQKFDKNRTLHKLMNNTT